jgi:hypothetical protein
MPQAYTAPVSFHSSVFDILDDNVNEHEDDDVFDNEKMQ